MTEANFDPEQFLDEEVESDMSTRGVPVPEGEYQAAITRLQPRTFEAKEPGKSDTNCLDVTWEIQNDPQLAEELGRTPTVRQRVFLDITSDGNLDTAKGRNTGLGKLREATGLNKPGESFRVNNLIGQVATITVSHRTHEGEIYDEVRRVSEA